MTELLPTVANWAREKTQCKTDTQLGNPTGRTEGPVGRGKENLEKQGWKSSGDLTLWFTVLFLGSRTMPGTCQVFTQLFA